MAKLRMAHASTHGARKPPGPTSSYSYDSNKDGTLPLLRHQAYIRYFSSLVITFTSDTTCNT